MTVTNTSGVNISIFSVAASPVDFGLLNACGNSIAAGSSCSIGIFFDPTASGTRSGTLTITDNGAGSPQTVALSGGGQDFSLVPSGQTTATVTPGQTAKYTVAVTPGGGFNQTVTLSCSGAPAQSTCSVSPSPLTLSGTSASMATVTVTTAGSSATLMRLIGGPSTDSMFKLRLALSGTLGLALLVSLVGWRRERRWLLHGLAFLLLFSIGITMSGCGGGSNGGSGGTPAGSYTLVVSGTFTSGSAKLTHDSNLTLVVQ